jgi:hypothetical protein
MHGFFAVHSVMHMAYVLGLDEYHFGRIAQPTRALAAPFLPTRMTFWGGSRDLAQPLINAVTKSKPWGNPVAQAVSLMSVVG